MQGLKQFYGTSKRLPEYSSLPSGFDTMMSAMICCAQCCSGATLFRYAPENSLVAASTHDHSLSLRLLSLLWVTENQFKLCRRNCVDRWTHWSSLMINLHATLIARSRWGNLPAPYCRSMWYLGNSGSDREWSWASRIKGEYGDISGAIKVSPLLSTHGCSAPGPVLHSEPKFF